MRGLHAPMLYSPLLWNVARKDLMANTMSTWENFIMVDLAVCSCIDYLFIFIYNFVHLFILSVLGVFLVKT